MILIKVPATSANLGAGFDTLGVALSLYNYVYMDYDYSVSDDKNIKHIKSKNYLLWRAAEKVFWVCGIKSNELCFKIESKANIPQTRGLGSSSACIVAGLIGANELLNRPLSKKKIADLAVELEGHPDNVAPAIFGGLVISAVNKNKLFMTKLRVNSGLKFAVVIPNFKMSTNKTRKILPKKVLLSDAVFNISRSTLFAVSMATGRLGNLRVASQDRLHQRRRLSLISNGERILSMLYSMGAISVYLSGSGPSIVAVYDRNIDNFVKMVRRKLLIYGMRQWRVFDLYPDNNGVRVKKI